jgi:hypothetical protein
MILKEDYMESSNKLHLVAPCGMNCGICRAYLREKNKCPGCRVITQINLLLVLDVKLKTAKLLKKKI